MTHTYLKACLPAFSLCTVIPIALSIHPLHLPWCVKDVGSGVGCWCRIGNMFQPGCVSFGRLPHSRVACSPLGWVLDHSNSVIVVRIGLPPRPVSQCTIRIVIFHWPRVPVVLLMTVRFCWVTSDPLLSIRDVIAVLGLKVPCCMILIVD